MDEEVTHFVADENGYYAILRKGERLDFIKVFHMQPPIEDPTEYSAFMFAETIGGFYLFSQKMVKNKAGAWEARIKIEAKRPELMYSQAQELWRSIRNRRGF